MIRTKQNSVNVQVDCATAVNLDKELEEMREQYEALILKNLKKIEQWFQNKVNWLFGWINGCTEKKIYRMYRKVNK